MSVPEAKLFGVLAAVVLVPLILAAGLWWFSRAARKGRPPEPTDHAQPPGDPPNPFGDSN
jgi:hypothetical protein